jgi:hypothetical protein
MADNSMALVLLCSARKTTPMPLNYQTLPLALVVLLLLVNQRVIIVAIQSPAQVISSVSFTEDDIGFTCVGTPSTHN